MRAQGTGPAPQMLKSADGLAKTGRRVMAGTGKGLQMRIFQGGGRNRWTAVTPVAAVAATVLLAAGCAAPSAAPVAVVGGLPPASSTPAQPGAAPAVSPTAAAPSPAVPAQSVPAPAPALPAAPAASSQPASALSDAVPASSSVPAPPESAWQPPACDKVLGLCLPWVWYKATSVINNNALLAAPTFGSSLDNNTHNTAMLHDTVTGTVTISAQLAGQLSANPSFAGISGGTVGIDPQVSASVTITETKTVDISVPAGDQGVILFGVPAVEVAGDVFTRSVTGKITTIPMDAWVPLNPSVFGFSAYVTPLAGPAQKHEIPVIPIPAG